MEPSTGSSVVPYRSGTDGQTYSGSTEDGGVGPRFIAGAVKLATIDHIERYQQLYLRRILPNDDEDPSQAADLGSNPEVDRLIRFKVIQGMLLNDINRLMGGISALDHLLASRRPKTWVTSILIATGLHAISEAPFIYRLLSGSSRVTLEVPSNHQVLPKGLYGISRFVSLVGYTIGIYQLFIFETSVKYTKRFRGELVRLQGIVREGERLDESRVSFLEDTWDSVPWHKVENRS